MDVRSQISMVFHLDKCLGCHTCSIACKNVVDRPQGRRVHVVEQRRTKPGTGYPTAWEDQGRYGGGWERQASGNGTGQVDGLIQLSSAEATAGSPTSSTTRKLPALDDYHEPWTYGYEDLFNAPPGDDQPTARPMSMITGKPIEIEAGELGRRSRRLVGSTPATTPT